MTIAVLWQEDGVLWCAADTRLVAGKGDQPTTEMAAKIYSIPMSTSATIPDTYEVRQKHYWTQYGFVFAGAVQPATMTAVTHQHFYSNSVALGNEPIRRSSAT